jgi:hypothetical protein
MLIVRSSGAALSFFLLLTTMIDYYFSAAAAAAAATQAGRQVGRRLPTAGATKERYRRKTFFCVKKEPVRPSRAKANNPCSPVARDDGAGDNTSTTVVVVDRRLLKEERTRRQSNGVPLEQPF